MEEVHHEIHEIDQHPPSPRNPFDVMRAIAVGRQPLEHRIAQSPDMCIRSPTSYDEEVGSIIDTSEVQDQQIGSFSVRNRVHSPPDRRRESSLNLSQ